MKVIMKTYDLKLWTEFGCIRLGSRDLLLWSLVMVIKDADYLDQLKCWLLSVELLGAQTEMQQSLIQMLVLPWMYSYK
jgi:hypothetical protein